jgi:simple sugar transport system permease protein
MIVLALLVGAGVGLVNGLVLVKTQLPSFIITLATNFIVIGATMGFSRLIANVTSASIVSDDIAKFVFAARLGQANISILWWLIVTIAGGFVLGRTTFGNWIYATGGNLQAARGAGVPVERVKIVLFVSTGVAAAFIGVLQGVEWNSGNSTYGMGYVFQAPIVAVIGGVLLTGGYGSVPGIFLGTAIFGVISTGIFYTGWSTDWIQLFLGVLLGGAVLANNYVRRLAMAA